MDKIPIQRFEGLEKIPRETLRKGNIGIIQYLLKLYKLPCPNYKTKLMVLGPQNVGKTSLINCLFSTSDWMKSQGSLKKTRYWFTLQGRFLRKFKDQINLVVHKEYYLAENQWSIDELSPNGFMLTPKTGGKILKIYCENDEQRNEWVEKLKRVINLASTQGIEIQSKVVDHPIIQESIRDDRLQMSVWDFSGQREFIFCHHYFISPKTIFILVWNMEEGEKGIQSLEPWFKFLSSCLGNIGVTNPGSPLINEDNDKREEEIGRAHV